MTIKELSQLRHLEREIQIDQIRLPAETSQRAIIQEKLERCINERNRLESYIASIPDSYIRQIFTLRFIYGNTWAQVATNLGGRNKEDSVRRACYRWIKKHSS